MLNPNGSWNVNERICIEGLTDYTPSAWTPGTRLDFVMQAFQTFMNGKDRNGVGFIKSPNASQCL